MAASQAESVPISSMPPQKDEQSVMCPVISSDGEDSQGQDVGTPCCAECGQVGGAELWCCAGCEELFHSEPPCLSPCGACGVPLCSHCRNSAVEHGCIGDGRCQEANSEGAQSTDPPSDNDEDAEEAEVNEMALEIAKELPEIVVPPLPAAGLVRHRRYGTIHAGCRQHRMTACGLTFMEADFEELKVWPRVPWPVCRRKKCFGS